KCFACFSLRRNLGLRRLDFRGWPLFPHEPLSRTTHSDGTVSRTFQHFPAPETNVSLPKCQEARKPTFEFIESLMKILHGLKFHALIAFSYLHLTCAFPGETIASGQFHATRPLCVTSK